MLLLVGIGGRPAPKIILLERDIYGLQSDPLGGMKDWIGIGFGSFVLQKKIKFLIWLSVLETLPTTLFRQIRYLSSSAFCPCCNQEPEFVYHCFFGCIAAKDVLAYIDPLIPIPPPSLHFLVAFRRIMKGRECLIAAGLWWIWRNRCNVIFSPDKVWTPQQLGNAASVICQTDSLDVYLYVMAYSNHVGDGDLLKKILDLRLRSWEVHFEHINRESNIVADFLAKQGAKDTRDYVEWLEPEHELQLLLAADLA
ncbi:hypothetical protein PIB30_018180 [Stylosanthes scabra]|uniref:Reverse transcriptase zinc-binding domain-containing protein n=1 Tax=Stylosanthes scabra TaxID=79078 RepID=A0ABU6S7U6_9FABA|nr:hypothetical protein [Stylosanthes scabra]